MIAGFSFIVNNLWTKYAALFYAIPLQFTISVIIMKINSFSNEQVSILSKEAVLWMIITSVFLLIYSYLLNKFNFLSATIVSYIIFILIWLLYITYYNA